MSRRSPITRSGPTGQPCRAPPTQAITRASPCSAPERGGQVAEDRLTSHLVLAALEGAVAEDGRGLELADSSREYAVGKAEIGQVTRDKDGRVMVNTRVTLLTGSTYNVIFQLSRTGNEYRILDVSVLGFSLSYLQRGIFQRYIAKNGGNVNALVAALNR